MLDRRQHLLDELARCFARAAVDALLAQEIENPRYELSPAVAKPGAENFSTQEINNHAYSTRRHT